MLTLNQQKLLIDHLDLSLIKAKLCLPCEKGGYAWPEPEAQKMIEEYKKFLFSICCKQAGKKQPTLSKDETLLQVVDVVWHTHILFTKKYHEDCQHIFGRYLHHDPLIDG